MAIPSVVLRIGIQKGFSRVLSVGHDGGVFPLLEGGQSTEGFKEVVVEVGLKELRSRMCT